MHSNEIQVFPCGAYRTNAYLVCPEGRTDAFLIDPGDDSEKLLAAVSASKRALTGILLTHGHFDHMLSAEPIQRQTRAMVYVSEKDAEMLTDPVKNGYDAAVSALQTPKCIDFDLYDETMEICGICLNVIPTPGHTRGSVCLYDAENQILFSGDTLFCAGYGRTDLYGGDLFALARSLKRLFALPEGVQVLPGHGQATAIGAERRRYRL